MWWPPPLRLVDSLLGMPLSQADRAALSQILETQPDLDRWRLRAQTVEEPEIGSDLALDDKIFPHWRSANSHGCHSSSPASICGSRSMR